MSGFPKTPLSLWERGYENEMPVNWLFRFYVQK